MLNRELQEHLKTLPDNMDIQLKGFDLDGKNISPSIKWLLEKCVFIKSKHFLFKHNSHEIGSYMASFYYKSFLGIIRASCYYSSYSQAYNAPIRFTHQY